MGWRIKYYNGFEKALACRFNEALLVILCIFQHKKLTFLMFVR